MAALYRLGGRITAARIALTLLAFFVSCFPHAFAQGSDSSGSSDIHWRKGPFVADLGDVAQINVPKGFAFTDAAGAKKFLELSQNPASGNELGLLIPVPKPGTDDIAWFMLFEFHDVGYITDKDSSSLDPAALLAELKKDTESANEVRKKRGWAAFHVVGWAKAPFYDSRTHNLTWAVLGRGDGENSEAVNYSVRVLGRRGTMSIDLIMDPRDMETTLPTYSELIEGFDYKSGNRYAEFMRGDKVAGYGLTALIAGGVGAAAVKTGLLSKLWRLITLALAALWKVIIFVVAGFFAFLKRMLQKLKDIFRKRQAPPSVSIQPEAPQLPASTVNTVDDFHRG